MISMMMSSAPAKSAGDVRYVSQDPFIDCPIQSRLQSVLGVCSIERNYTCNFLLKLLTTVYIIICAHNYVAFFYSGLFTVICTITGIETSLMCICFPMYLAYS